MNSYQVFHTSSSQARNRIQIILVRPEQGGNVGSAARALANTGILGDFRIVGSPDIVDAQCERMAKHAKDRLSEIQHFATLKEALNHGPGPKPLTLASTARIGSAHRPHPLWVRPAMEKAIQRLRAGEISDLRIVFGPESDGLTNEEVALCDWVVTIPSASEYRSLNLAQAILVFCYEAHLNLIHEPEAFQSEKPSQKERVGTHIIRLAEEVGFILPGDPYKMKPRLEEILAKLPNHIKDARTLHGLIAQIIRTVRAGHVQYKGRYRHRANQLTPDQNG